MAKVTYAPQQKLSDKLKITQPANGNTGVVAPKVTTPAPTKPTTPVTPKPTVPAPTTPKPTTPTPTKPPTLPSGPTLPPPINEPVDLRKTNPTPNDKPKTTIPPPTGDPKPPVVTTPTQKSTVPTAPTNSTVPANGNTGVVKPTTGGVVVYTPPPPTGDPKPPVVTPPPKTTTPTTPTTPTKPTTSTGNTGVVKPTTDGVVVYNPPTTPTGDPRTSTTPPPKGTTPSGDPNDPSGGRGTVPPKPPAPPVVTGDPPPRTETRTTPIPTIPTKGGTGPGNPVDPTGGGGVMNPTDKSQVNWNRRNETPEQRLARLEEKLRSKGGTDPALEERIKQLKDRMAKGELKPGAKFEDQPGRLDPATDGLKPYPRVQLDDDPTTWTPEMLSELALPRGMDPIFYDNANSTDKKETDPLTGKPKKGDSDNDGTLDKNEVRRSETLQQRLKRLQKKNKDMPSDQLNERIKKLKDRIKSQGGTVDEDEVLTGSDVKPKPNSPAPKPNGAPANEDNTAKLKGRLTQLEEKYKTKPNPDLKARIDKIKGRLKAGTSTNTTGTQTTAKTTAQADAKTKPNPTSQVPSAANKEQNKGTRKNENLKDRLTRLKEKYKTKPTAELKQRIAELEARIKVGDTKGNTTDQPGTPTRPFRNRGVSYRPLSYGGSLRV